MRTWSFFVLAYLVLSLQLALSGFLTWGAAVPNLVLPIVVFIAVNAGREGALAGAFTIGLLHDLLSPNQPIGLFAFSYGLTALFVVSMQPSLYRDHPLTHFFITLSAAAVVAAVGLFNQWAYPILHSVPNPPRPLISAALLSALYTAALAPLLLWPLVKLKTTFAFRGTRHGRMARH